MKAWFLIIPLVLSARAFAQSGRLEGYVLNPDAFQKIQSFCIDTHNQPSDEVAAIDRVVARESRAKGLLSKLPWRRFMDCSEPEIDALVRIEFPAQPSLINNGEIAGALLVFRPGSPTPIYETPAVTVPKPDGASLSGKLAMKVLRYNAASYAFRILIHDWQQRLSALR